MKRALAVVVLFGGCGGEPAPTSPVPSATPSASAAPSASTSVAVQALPPTTRDHIAAFAASRGGLHGEPARMPYRTSHLKGAECWLFFVGGDAAHAAWLATPWVPSWGKASASLPSVSAGAQAPTLEDGVVFERVDKWPRALKVISTTQKPAGDGLFVNVESLAARDQPGGITGMLLVHDDPIAGSMPEALPAWTEEPEMLTSSVTNVLSRPPTVIIKDDAQKKIATAMLKKASASSTAIAGSIGSMGAVVFEVWQGVFLRRVGLATDANVKLTRASALREAVNIGASQCDPHGLCVADTDRPGVALVAEGAGYRIGAFLIPPIPPSLTREPAPTPTRPDEALAALRMNEKPNGTPRVITSVAIGDARVLVAQDDDNAYLVERDGAYSIATRIWSQRVPKSAVEARIEDIDGDGIADITLFARWQKQDNADMHAVHTSAIVAMRSRNIGSTPIRDHWGREIDMIGSLDLDDALKRARTTVIGATATKAEACAVLSMSTTPSGLVRSSTASARIISFDEPQDPSRAVRLVPVARATADDAAALKDACTSDADGGFFCRNGLCGNLDYGLGNIFRFVRDGKALKLETAMIYTGS